MLIQQHQKDELVTRAVEHREADRLIQSYGYFEPMDYTEAEHYNLPGNNGEKTDWREGDWAGCAIGCLATPVMSQEEYRKLWEESPGYGTAENMSKGWEECIEVLDEEFGIDRTLTRMAEALFERLSKEDAQRWPEQFARALPVGVPFDMDDLCKKEGVWKYGADSYFRDNENAADARDELLSYLSEVSQHAAV